VTNHPNAHAHAHPSHRAGTPCRLTSSATPHQHATPMTRQPRTRLSGAACRTTLTSVRSLPRTRCALSLHHEGHATPTRTTHDAPAASTVQRSCVASLSTDTCTHFVRLAQHFVRIG